jgi:hypothetical protein
MTPNFLNFFCSPEVLLYCCFCLYFPQIFFYTVVFFVNDLIYLLFLIPEGISFYFFLTFLALIVLISLAGVDSATVASQNGVSI